MDYLYEAKEDLETANHYFDVGKGESAQWRLMRAQTAALIAIAEKLDKLVEVINGKKES